MCLVAEIGLKIPQALYFTYSLSSSWSYYEVAYMGKDVCPWYVAHLLNCPDTQHLNADAVFSCILGTTNKLTTACLAGLSLTFMMLTSKMYRLSQASNRIQWIEDWKFPVKKYS